MASEVTCTEADVAGEGMAHPSAMNAAATAPSCILIAVITFPLADVGLVKLSSRFHFTGCASGNTQVPSMISFRGRYWLLDGIDRFDDLVRELERRARA